MNSIDGQTCTEARLSGRITTGLLAMRPSQPDGRKTKTGFVQLLESVKCCKANCSTEEKADRPSWVSGISKVTNAAERCQGVSKTSYRHEEFACKSE